MPFLKQNQPAAEVKLFIKKKQTSKQNKSNKDKKNKVKKVSPYTIRHSSTYSVAQKMELYFPNSKTINIKLLIMLNKFSKLIFQLSPLSRLTKAR